MGLLDGFNFLQGSFLDPRSWDEKQKVDLSTQAQMPPMMNMFQDPLANSKPLTPQNLVNMPTDEYTFQPQNVEMSKVGSVAAGQVSPVQQPSFMDKVGDTASSIGKGISDFTNDRERMLRLAQGFNSMRLEPDQGLATAIQGELKDLRAHKGANKTVGAIQGLINAPGTSDAEKYRLQMILKGVQDGVITPADAYTQALKRKPAPLVDMGGEKYYDAIAKDIANMQTTHRERGELARSSLNALNELNTAINKFGETGPDKDTKQTLRVMASKYGLGHLIDEEKMSSGQYVEAIKNRMVAEELRRNKGPQTDFDAKFAGTYIPGLGTSTEANNALMNYSKSISLQQTILSTMSADIRLSDFDSAKQTIKTIDKLSLMSPGAMERPDGTWITFNEFFNADIDEIKKMSAQERLIEWSNRYKQRMGFR